MNKTKDLRTMKKTMRKRFFDSIRYRSTPGWVTWVSIAGCLLMIFAIVGIVRTQVKISEQREKLAQLEAECRMQESENKALDELLNNGSEYIERRAREDLDMVLPGERVYIIRAGS